MIVRVGQAVIDCFEAHSIAEFRIGLSETNSLPPGRGMLFICPKTTDDRPWSFWMPSKMKFGLDIVYITASGHISLIHANCQPGDGKKYPGTGRWVLEVPAGFCAEAGIKHQDKVEFEEEHELDAMQSTDLLRTLTTASKVATMADVVAQSTETEPYSRAPSVAPTTPPEERSRIRDTLTNQVPDGGLAVTEGPIHDESWNSPTRGS